MTGPDDSQQRAQEALKKATEIRNKGVTIAEKWRKSQKDNNFRQMLRQIGKGIATDGHP